jgi:RNA polymerase sigma-70 factor (ECF subfamily)
VAGALIKNVPDEDTDLIIRFKRGEDAAFGELLHKYQKPVVNFIRRFLSSRSRSDAEDLAQEVFLKIYKALAWYQPKGKFTAYLYKTAVNCSLSHIRKNKNPVFVSIDSSQEEGEDSLLDSLKDTSAPLPDEVMLKEELRRMVEEAIRRLPEGQRITLILNQYQGLSYKEIASVLECSVKSVERRLYRARMSLKEKLLPYLNKGTPVT